MTNFGKTIKEKKLSVYAISQATGISTMTLYGWAKGYHKPNLWSDNLQKVLAYLKSQNIVLEPADFVTAK